MSNTSEEGDIASPRKALHACTPCRKQKKGCNKALPSCSSCLRLNRPCKYWTGLPPTIPNNYEALKQRISYLEKELNEHRQTCYFSTFSDSTDQPLISTELGSFQSTSSAFPSAFFLDVEIFEERKLDGPKPSLSTPDYIFRAIGDEVEIQSIIGAHFFSTFTWMGIVSKKKLYQENLVPSAALEADVALLILCMKLVNDRAAVDAVDSRTNLYATAKGFYRLVESSGIVSMRLLQAGLLIALYETGHAIYPEAYLTIGQCARVGTAIGLDDTGHIPQLGLEPQNWDDMEERRRVWWAYFILDRHMNIGNPTRKLALAEPGRRVYLPVDDNAWERGETVASEPLFISSSTNIAAAPFARLGQACNLLSLVLAHINDRNGPLDFKLEEARQLDRALVALCAFLHGDTSKEATRICVPIGVCYSALILLYENCAKAGGGKYSLPAEKELQELGTNGLDALLSEVIAYATHIQMILPYNTDQASPFILNCLYRTAVMLSKSPSSNPTALDCMKQTMYKLGSRWRLALEYLKLLEDKDLAS